MTTEIEGIKTNEFLRRRKLRLQQVREQSKDIAKKIRQRAKVEKLRQVAELDSKKESEYLKHQEKLVKRLELLYAKGVSSVGAGHKQAVELTQASPEKTDLSRQRGREATAELRKKRQEQLDEHKKILDRKLQAREAANELSREKSTNVASKLLAKTSTTTVKEPTTDKSPNEAVVEDANDNVDKEAAKRSDMATQWDLDGVANDWEPVPSLSLPKDDSEKESFNNNAESKSDKSKRIDLFALSEEMPSSLRGGLADIPEERVPIRPSFTQVSEYLQNRGLRLRDTEKVATKPTGDLHSLKQTILRTRTSQNEGKGKPREKSPTNFSTTNFSTSTVTPKRNSVTVYNHSTRDTRNVPCGDERLVIHNTSKNEDAYSQAMKESSTSDAKDREHQQRLQEMRSKIAMTKQNVEKEYSDTLSFLNSLPKEKGRKTMKTAYMDERCEKMLKDNRQHKLQQEFRKIEKECRKHGPMNSNKCSSNYRHRSKSPEQTDTFEGRDFQYSWMPVPESDGSLAIHTIPTTTKPKSGNSVKFSKVDSYHEYRSRHKHTPPTKEKDQEPKTLIETVLIQNESETSDTSSSDTSSVENLCLDPNQSKKKTKKQHNDELTDAERIIIYKVLDSKKKEKAKKKAKLISDIAKSLQSRNKDKPDNEGSNHIENNMELSKEKVQDKVSFEHIQEGIYKTTKEKGLSYNVTSCYTANVQLWQTSSQRKPWWDNITSLYFTDKSGEGQNIILTEDEIRHGKPCCCKKLEKDQQRDTGTKVQLEKGDRGLQDRRTKGCNDCKCGCSSKRTERVVPAAPQPSAATSTSSFRTATTDKDNPAFPEGGFIKLLDDEGQEAGKFYIGASGFLKDDDYEVIIQLRKKDSGKEEKKLDKPADNKLNTIKEAEHHEGPLPTTPIAENISETRGHVPNEDITKTKTVETSIAPVENTSAILKETKTAKIETREARTSTEELSKRNLEEIISSSNVDEIEETQEINYSDKGVCTSFQLAYAFPSNFPISDTVPRPGTSTYTQTSFNTTNPRPAYVHMSSSTSTAYMSPPEVVLPRFLRPDSDEDNNKVFSSEFCRSNKHYQCNKNCTYSTKNVTNMEDDNLPGKPCLKKVVTTPPNTARSYTTASEIPYDDGPNILKNKRHRCHRCAAYSESGKCHKSQGLKNTRCSAAKKKPTLPKHTVSSVASSSRNTWNLKKKDNNANFNPVIKNYVNKLLSLNKEGIKAIEVANQECSSVATPGSSIIDVPRNVAQKTHIEHKISLEQIKNELIKKILTDYVNKAQTENKNKTERETNHNIHIKVSAPRLPKKRSVHKVKSLNISKRILKNKKATDIQRSVCNEETTVCNMPTVKPDIPVESRTCSKDKVRSKSSPTPRLINPEYKRKSSASDVSTEFSKRPEKYNPERRKESTNSSLSSNKQFPLPIHRASSATIDSGTATVDRQEFRDTPVLNQNQEVPNAISTQTSCHLDSETNYVKLAENKLQNMEKIANLTEKCTQRLSSLAKALEEVRKNKSLAYSQISSSDTTSETDQQADKKLSSENSNSGQSIDIDDIHKKFELKPSTPALTSDSEGSETLDSSKYVSFLTDIPKPMVAKILPTEREITFEICQKTDENLTTKSRPPPALSRLHLRNGQGFMTPHELSTVVEVDSPMSVRLKNSSRVDNKSDMPDSVDATSNANEVVKEIASASVPKDNNIEEVAINPDLLQSNLSLSKTKLQPRKSTTDSSDESKLQMMDLKQFNEIMLQPFISIQEYAKQYDIGTMDEASNLDDVPKEDVVNEELSSMQSDSSLPDVIAELLKRKIISEPFKFDTVSNIHSSTGSSESSVLALSKVRREKKKSTVVFQDKENAAESSDTMSFSSNPDLENAFKKLGMGWASSTLKKTKERLALSSSSNTSTSSASQFKIKSFNNQDIPALVTDSVSSIMQLTRKEEKKNSKNIGQQTSMVKSMTVKEFLTNELADKITFTNKSRRDETEEEFVSLFETKMPEDMKHSSQMAGEERSVDSTAGGNRARTSTPVQIFKSMTYHSSSSSNMSNGLFSNADDLSSVKVTSNSIRNHSTSDKDDLTIPNCSLRIKKASDASKSD